MWLTQTKMDVLGIFSCITFVASSITSWFAEHLHFSSYLYWLLGLGIVALIGSLVAIFGIILGICKKRIPAFSAIGLILNGAFALLVLFVVALSSMH